MMAPELLLAGFTAAAAFFLGLAVARVRLRRPIAAARSGIGSVACLAISGLFLSIGLNLYTYQRLTFEQPVATLGIHKIGPQRFMVRLDPAHQPARRFKLAGDQWQLDARVLKWTGIGTLLGLDARYRLQRLSGRYANALGTNRRLHTAYDLAKNPGLDLAWLATHDPGWIPLVDAVYGSATYLPMADGARYTVTLSRTGLLARPANEAARRAIRSW